jgi:type II secretory pathway pseudopilin PulG
MATRRISRRQRGAALMLFLILVVVGALTYLLASLSPEEMKARRDAKTAEALAQARDALIGYALQYRERQMATGGTPDAMYGYLPMPDLGATQNNNSQPNSPCEGEGCAKLYMSGAFPASTDTVIGRFPWRTLGLPPLKDGYGECLWYIVSASHKSLGIDPAVAMNWDTLAKIDVVGTNDSDKLKSMIASAHDRPVAIIFSPGPPLANQSRSPIGGDVVTECGGNYNPANYIEPNIAADLLDYAGNPTTLSAYFSGSQATDTSTANLAVATQSAVVKDGTLLKAACPSGTACATVANDLGLPLTNDTLFGALRKSSNFRLDINTMLDRMASCLRDQIAAGTPLPPASPVEFAAPADKSARRIPDTPATDPNVVCYDDTKDPRGYFGHYKRQVFVAALPDTAALNACKASPDAANCFGVTVDGGTTQYCPGVVILGSQRRGSPAQLRDTGARQNDPANYLEGDNLAGFTGTTRIFAGPNQFARVSSTHSAHQDIVRCIPAGPSMSEAASPLSAATDLIRYDPGTRTLTLGRTGVESDTGYAAGNLFGCSWTPEAHASGSGFRSYFKFNIRDSGDGFVFAAIDGDRNTAGVCGAAQQHLGYSGNNNYTSIIASPKIGLEFDTRRNYQFNAAFQPYGFNPARLTSVAPVTYWTLANGRADPSYAGGHIGLVYWGGEASISTGAACVVTADCLSPAVCEANICKLEQVEDDNVHGQLPVAAATRPPPRNPVAPAVPPANPPYPPYAVDKLDPSLSSVPTNQEIHVRIEVARSAYAGRDDNSRLVRIVATANIAPLAGLATVDSVVLQAGDTVLVAGQTDARQNGIYVATAGTWTRSTAADEAADLPPGTSWFVREGTAYRGSLWRLQNLDAPIVGIDALDVRRVRAAVAAVATTDLALSGLQTVDGVALASGDRVLLAAQTDPRQNGVYAAGSGSWARATPEDSAAGMLDGSVWFVAGGSQAGTYWRLNGDVIPGTSNAVIALVTSNDIYSTLVTTQVWKEASNAQQIERMKITSRAMAQLDPVVRHGQCAAVAPLCPASNPVDQSCGGVETDGLRYCYTGQKPKLYDSQRIYDVRPGVACTAGASCATAGQFCGIDNYCYQPAFRTMRLGFTNSQSTSSQEIDISDFFTTWLP